MALTKSSNVKVILSCGERLSGNQPRVFPSPAALGFPPAVCRPFPCVRDLRPYQSLRLMRPTRRQLSLFVCRFLSRLLVPSELIIPHKNSKDMYAYENTADEDAFNPPVPLPLLRLLSPGSWSRYASQNNRILCSRRSRDIAGNALQRQGSEDRER